MTLTPKGDPMSDPSPSSETGPVLRTVKGFRVKGFSVRTSNPEEFAGASRIADLWRHYEAMSHECGDGPPVAVYDSYASDHMGKYSLTLGVSAPADASPPPSGATTDVPAGSYLVYPVGEGEMPGALIATWQQIWGDFTSGDFPFVRTFECDFEQHGLETEIYIGVEPRTP